MDENNNNNFVQEIFHDLFSSMEALETQSAAVLQFLKDKGIATDEELASHLEQAENASSVRWRGVRVRADYLFASSVKAAEQAAERESTKHAEMKPESKPDTRQSGGKETAKGAKQVATQNAANQQADNEQADNEQPEHEQPQSDKPEADEASARVEQEAEQEVEQEVERNGERDIEQDVKQDRNQRDDADNRPRKNDTEQAA
jgi:exosome complex component RRP41